MRTADAVLTVVHIAAGIVAVVVGAAVTVVAGMGLAYLGRCVEHHLQKRTAQTTKDLP